MKLCTYITGNQAPIVGEFTKIIDEGLSFLKEKYRITAKQLQREGKLNRQQYEAFVLSMERIVKIGRYTREESFCDLLSLRQTYRRSPKIPIHVV